MSLILEALRKRERDKQVPERGFLVLAEAPWAPARGRGLWASIAAAGIAFGLGAAFVSLRERPHAPSAATPLEPTPAATPRSAAPAPTPAVTLLPAATHPAQAPVALATPVAPAELPAASLDVAAPATTLAPARLVLQAISERDGRPVALISDHLLREGDTLEGARIVHIGETEVELELDGRRLILRF